MGRNVAWEDRPTTSAVDKEADTLVFGALAKFKCQTCLKKGEWTRDVKNVYQRAFKHVCKIVGKKDKKEVILMQDVLVMLKDSKQFGDEHVKQFKTVLDKLIKQSKTFNPVIKGKLPNAMEKFVGRKNGELSDDPIESSNDKSKSNVAEESDDELIKKRPKKKSNVQEDLNEESIASDDEVEEVPSSIPMSKLQDAKEEILTLRNALVKSLRKNDELEQVIAELSGENKKLKAKFDECEANFFEMAQENDNLKMKLNGAKQELKKPKASAKKPVGDKDAVHKEESNNSWSAVVRRNINKNAESSVKSMNWIEDGKKDAAVAALKKLSAPIPRAPNGRMAQNGNGKKLEAVYVNGFSRQNIGQVKKSLRDLKFQLSRILWIDFIGPNFAEFLIEAEYKALFKKHIEECGASIITDFNQKLNLLDGVDKKKVEKDRENFAKRAQRICTNLNKKEEQFKERNDRVIMFYSEWLEKIGLSQKENASSQDGENDQKPQDSESEMEDSQDRENDLVDTQKTQEVEGDSSKAVSSNILDSQESSQEDNGPKNRLGLHLECSDSSSSSKGKENSTSVDDSRLVTKVDAAKKNAASKGK